MKILFGHILQDERVPETTSRSQLQLFIELLDTARAYLRMIFEQNISSFYKWSVVVLLFLFVILIIFRVYFSCKQNNYRNNSEAGSEDNSSRSSSLSTGVSTVESPREVIVHPPLVPDNIWYKTKFAQPTCLLESSLISPSISMAMKPVLEDGEDHPRGLLSRRGKRLSKLKLSVDNETSRDRDSGIYPGPVFEVETSVGRLTISSEMMNVNSVHNNPDHYGYCQGNSSGSFVEHRSLVEARRPRDFSQPLRFLDRERTNPVISAEEFLRMPLYQQIENMVPGSRLKNRYPDVLPNENTRVSFPHSLVGHNYYINANYISGYQMEPRAYIATQGPLPNTIVDFWNMVWYSDADVIVMLTNFYEHGIDKCQEYFPLGDGHIGSKNTSYYGPFEVTVLTLYYSVGDGYALRIFDLKRGAKTRKIYHFWFEGWEDHMVPAVLSPLIFLAWLVEILRSENLRDYCLESPSFERSSKCYLSLLHSPKNHPVVVHCSAGLGRTGCFLAVCIGINEIIYKGDADVCRILCQLRKDRGRMVPSYEEYKLIHQALGQFKLLNSEGKIKIPNISFLY